MSDRLEGLIAATYTPMDDQGRVSLGSVPPMVDRLIGEGVSGLYVCGSTGEGMSLTGAERKEVAEAFVRACAGRVPVVVQVGHNSVAEAAELAAHAQRTGADAVSATAPSYFKVDSIELLADCMAGIARGAPELPFYYYHIPSLTGAALDMPAFLKRAGERIPSLAGIKYTCPTVHEYQACLELDDGRFDVLWGCDEMLLSALAAGARGAVGSTYNVAAPLYGRIIAAFRSGRLDEARRLQGLSVKMIRTIARWPFHPAMKEILSMLGLECGRCRLPQPRLGEDQVDALRKDLQRIGFFDWARPN
ncbi:MAG: dihydrodipicolinate synthase family protein [Planctomycetota bacterium]|jgi:N-acetylneuraminate lyase